MFETMMRHSVWFVVGLLITSLQLRLMAKTLGMSKEQLATLIDEHRTWIVYVSWLNGCAILFTISGAVTLLALHIAGAF